MTAARVYLDEDVQSDALIHALRSRGVSLLTTSEAGMANRTDEEQLRFAAAQDRVLITSNIADFARLHGDWAKAGQNHSGIILVRQQKWGAGELARRIIRFLLPLPIEDMRGRLEFLRSD